MALSLEERLAIYAAKKRTAAKAITDQVDQMEKQFGETLPAGALDEARHTAATLIEVSNDILAMLGGEAR